jgi:DNA replication protein DnaC
MTFFNQKNGSCELAYYKDRLDWIKEFVPERFRNLTLDNYTARTAQQATALAVARKHLNRMATGCSNPMYIYGPPGTGKTELASAFWNSFAGSVPDMHDYRTAARLGTADNIAFVNGSQIPELVKRDKDNHGFELLCSCQFAVIDDLDKCSAGWNEALYRLVDCRMSQCCLPTIITANNTPNDLIHKYKDGTAIVDRLRRFNGLFIRLDQKPDVKAQDAQP